MARRDSSGSNAIPKLVVKIIGGKQVKHFIQEPVGDTLKGAETPPEAVEDTLKDTPDKQDVRVSRSHRRLEDGMSSALQAALNAAPDRLCVTAPSGDRSLSYIHQRSLQRTKPKGTAEASESTEQMDQPEEEEERDKDRLSMAVGEELADWQPSSLRSIGKEAVALDPALSGTLNQSEITYVFLSNEVPLKLPTFHLLLQMFSDKSSPDRIHYKHLLHFLSSAMFPREQHNSGEAESGCTSQTSSSPGATGSVRRASVAPVALVDTETWLQRFHRLERAMHMCDTKNTGYMDKDRAKRLIQNYNRILDLNLSALKINEATHGAPNQSQLDLDSALQNLKEL